MKQKITMAAVLIGLFLLFGTGGAMERDVITLARGVLQAALIIMGMAAAIKIGRLWEDAEEEW